MKVIAPAKINLFLEVGKKINSYHKIISLLEMITLHDEIELLPSDRDEIEFLSEWEIPDDNTIRKTVELIRKITDCKRKVKIKVRKKIPPGSGLGGGSSDAASVLKGLNKLWKINFNNEKLLEIGKKVGSDVPFFIFGRRGIIEGCGEIVRDVNCKTIFKYLLLIPPFQVKTEEIYRELDREEEYGDLTEGKKKIKILLAAMEKNNIKEMENIMMNRLEKPCFNFKKEIKEVREEIEKITGRKFFLSGSGGTLFSILYSEEEVEKVRHLPFLKEWKVFCVRSLFSSE